MAKEPQKDTLKDLRRDIEQQMEESLPRLKEILGEKKFSGRVKKAAKILVEGIAIKEKKVKAPEAAATKATAKASPDKIKPAPKAKADKVKPATSKVAGKKEVKSAPKQKKTVAIKE